MARNARVKQSKTRAKQPQNNNNGRPIFGRLKGRIQIVGEIVSSIVPPEDWQGDLNNFERDPEAQS